MRECKVKHNFCTPRFPREYPVASGHEKWKALMKKQFPGEDEAIDKFFKMLSTCEIGMTIISVLKICPLWLSWLLTKTGVVHLLTSVFGKEYKKPTLELVSELTKNRDLRNLFCYNWGDHGLEPSKAPFIAQAMVNNHFLKQGGWYPVGGSSEFAFNMVPIIERYGGKVLVSKLCLFVKTFSLLHLKKIPGESKRRRNTPRR